MPGNGNSTEFEANSRSNTASNSVQSYDDDIDRIQRVTAWRSRERKWKEHYDEFLPPGNYRIHTHDTDINTAHNTVASLFDGLTDYHIWNTRDVSSSAKARRRDDPAHKHVLVRTKQPIPVDELPDTPRITSY